MSGIREVRAPDWQPIETAPHEEELLLGWWTEDGQGGCDWASEVGCASHGWRRGSISNMSRHGQATYWMKLPPPPPSRLQELADATQKPPSTESPR